jgi:hypothetical protein
MGILFLAQGGFLLVAIPFVPESWQIIACVFCAGLSALCGFGLLALARLKATSGPISQPMRITPLRAAILAPWFAVCMYVSYVFDFGFLAVIAVNVVIVLLIGWLGNPWRVRD